MENETDIFDGMDELQTLAEAYMQKHPKATDPRQLVGSFTARELIRILNEAGGRRIVFLSSTKFIDLVTYYFK